MSDNDLDQRQRDLLDIAAGLVPATPVQMATALGRASNELEQTRLELEIAERDYDAKAGEHDREYDLAFLAEVMKDDRVGYAPIARAKARDATWELRLAMEQAKTEVGRLRKRIDVLDKRLMVAQSIQKTLRAELRNLNYNDWGA